MAVDCYSLSEAVKKVLDKASCESDWRAVCSRAYYVIYQDGFKFHEDLETGGVRTSSDGGMHEDLLDRLCNPSLKRNDPNYLKSKSLGYKMRTVYANRIRADYKRSEDITLDHADNSIAYMDEVINLLYPPSAQKDGRPTLTRIK